MALLVKRRRDESVTIGGMITVTVVRSTLGGCTLSIDAPESIKILRSELVDPDDPGCKVCGESGAVIPEGLPVCGPCVAVLGEGR